MDAPQDDPKTDSDLRFSLRILTRAILFLAPETPITAREFCWVMGLRVRTEGELEASLERAATYRGGPVLIEVMLDQTDSSDQLKRLCAEIARHGATKPK